MPAIPLKISDLLLDSENPRLRSPKTQLEALQEIIVDQKERLYNLAEHIAGNGLSPIDRMLVLRIPAEPLRYIALEGNRRVAALKILANPAILASLKLAAREKAKYESLAATFVRSRVEPIDAWEMESRDVSRPWIELRHTGANAGRGLVDWESIQAARFRGEEGPGMQAIAFVTEFADFSEEDVSLLDKGFPITTLDRILRSPGVRDAIGLTWKGGRLQAKLQPSQALKPLKKIILDLAHKRIRVNKVHTARQQVDYVSGFDPVDAADLDAVIDERPLNAFTSDDFKPSRKKRRKRLTSERLTVAPRTLKLNISDDRVAGIFAELQSLKVDQMPNASAVLIRIFLEMSVDFYLTKAGIPTELVHPRGGTFKSLNSKVKEAVDHLVSSGARQKDFLSVSLGVDKENSPLFTGLLNSYVHNRFVTPKPTELKSTWSDAQPFFEALWQ